MRRPTLTVVLPACLAIGVLSSFRIEESADESAAVEPVVQEDETGEEVTEEVGTEEVDPRDRHLRAPVGVNLHVSEGTWVRAPGDEWFEQQAELDSERFWWDGSLRDGEGGWVDALGLYQLQYDEEEEEWAYWEWLSAAKLTRGRQDYVQFCASCHGLEGDGYGRSGQHLRPAPRDFRQANFKFTKVTKSLPSDAALKQLVKNGLAGTPMLPWALQDEQLDEIIAYIKSLSPPGVAWRDLYAEIGDVVESGEDPWIGREAQAVKRGEKVYHKDASCHLCHPGYATHERLAQLRGDAPGTRYREDLTYPALKDSDYEVLGEKVKILPPDFTWHQVRAGTTPQDLFETIAAGIKGTAMPQWKGALPDEDLWALAHYVHDLIGKYKDRPAERAAFMRALRQDS